MRRTPISLLTVLLLATGADAARAQSCPAPKIEFLSAGTLERGFIPVDHFRVGSPSELEVEVTGATAVEIDWRDGQRQRVRVRRGFARVKHVYMRAGRRQIVATAFAGCGAASAPGGLTVPIVPRCERTRGRDVFRADCDTARGHMTLSAGGLLTDGTWLNRPCRDVIDPPLSEPPEPVARPAACSGPATEPPYTHLPVTSPDQVLITLGAPAARVTAALGSPDGSTARRRNARRVGRRGLRWRIRLPRSLGSRDRLEIRARRARGRDDYVVGINPG